MHQQFNNKVLLIIYIFRNLYNDLIHNCSNINNILLSAHWES